MKPPPSSENVCQDLHKDLMLSGPTHPLRIETEQGKLSTGGLWRMSVLQTQYTSHDSLSTAMCYKCDR